MIELNAENMEKALVWVGEELAQAGVEDNHSEKPSRLIYISGPDWVNKIFGNDPYEMHSKGFALSLVSFVNAFGLYLTYNGIFVTVFVINRRVPKTRFLCWTV